MSSELNEIIWEHLSDCLPSAVSIDTSDKISECIVCSGCGDIIVRIE